VVYKFIIFLLFTCDKALWGFEQTKNVTMTIWFQMSNDFTDTLSWQVYNRLHQEIVQERFHSSVQRRFVFPLVCMQHKAINLKKIARLCHQIRRKT